MRVNENLSKNGIGVEVSEFSLSDLTAENIDFLRAKWVEYGLIVFPKLPLSHDEFKDFALSFGEFGDDPFFGHIEGHKNFDEQASFSIERVGGIKLLRKYRKAQKLNQ